MSIGKEIYGRGPAYPFKRGKGGDFGIAEGKALVEMGFKQIIFTSKGRRPMLKDIGVTFNKLLFSIQGVARDAVIGEFLSIGMERFEPRVSVLNAKVVDKEKTNEFAIAIEYMLLEGNIIGSTIIDYKG